MLAYFASSAARIGPAQGRRRGWRRRRRAPGRTARARARGYRLRVALLASTISMATLLLCTLALGRAEAQLFDAPLFSSGMILQRGEGTRVWGTNAAGPVTVTVSGGIKATSGQPSRPHGSWIVSLPNMAAALTSTVAATDGNTTDTLTDVAIGDVLLCGGNVAPSTSTPIIALKLHLWF